MPSERMTPLAGGWHPALCPLGVRESRVAAIVLLFSRVLPDFLLCDTSGSDLIFTIKTHALQ